MAEHDPGMTFGGLPMATASGNVFVQSDENIGAL
jgi:hypothetical protein